MLALLQRLLFLGCLSFCSIIFGFNFKPLVFTFAGQEDSTIYATFNHDGTKIITISYKCLIKAWNIINSNDGLKINSIDNEHSIHCCIQVARPNEINGLIVHQDNTSIEIWDIDNNKSDANFRASRASKDHK